MVAFGVHSFLFALVAIMSSVFFKKGEQGGGARKNSELEPEIIKNVKVNTSRFSSADWRST